ncbi:TetR family transcriptional regulator C-terminal domain-containing protein [uncultured Paracoccus sp.]|uniref:TetR family transcriptional regulator C-terminal domain-containing protein n=1 Tax=uncultured Paracoccus sp. TaxID=189685 RepID=UPI002610625A|nr:TetR family transcriptional regulator C-terminal domain-containing protein [uncultured Paracoccus sp.]
MSKDERRSSIINAAVEIALTKGLTGATVRAVAKAIDASPGQIHHHFASASDLRAEAFRTAINRVAVPGPDELAGMVPLDRLLSALIGEGQAFDVQTAGLWNEALAVARKDGIVRKAVRGLMEECIESIKEIIEKGQSTGDFRKDVKPGEVATRLVAVAMGLDLLASLELETRASSEEIKDLVARGLLENQ